MASHGARPVAMVSLLAALAAPTAAAAEPYQLGAFFGPRFFSENSSLGDHPDDEFRTTLDTSFAFGPRLARPLFSWFVPELEVPISVAQTKDLDVTVYWFEPRAHLRFVWPLEKLRPFAVLGGGVPMNASSKRGLFASDVSWEGYGGIGAMFVPGRGLSFRLDVRVGLTDGFEEPIAVEVEATVGLFFELEGGKPRRKKPRPLEPSPTDVDGDHIADADDRCVDRPEDEDGWEDRDGCPDIDNDLDEVLDIADACATVPESYNGFEDDDGCQDTIPGDVSDILGTIEGLLYNPGSTDVPGTATKALDRIVAVLEKRPSVRVVVIGHTDDREAEIAPVENEAPEDTAQRQADALVELSRERAAAVRDALVERGLARGRIDVAGKGGADPVSDNDRPRTRLRNRRVELQLYIPARD